MSRTAFLVFASALLLLIPSVCAATKRYAKVKVINHSSRTIAAISLVHKYSDVYKSSAEWGLISDGHHSSLHQVAYNTGWLTTGRDWWMVTWYDDKLKTEYYLDPANLRNVVDVLEAVAPIVAAGVAGYGGAVLAGPAGAQLGMGIALAVSNELTNSATTAGFKQHILSSDDEGHVVSIYLFNNGDVKIESPSGVSWTKYSSRPVS